MGEDVAAKGQDILLGYGPVGVFCLILIAVIVVLWRKVNDDQERIAALNEQLNVEIKGGIAMAQEFRESFERSVDKFQALIDLMDQRRNQ